MTTVRGSAAKVKSLPPLGVTQHLPKSKKNILAEKGFNGALVMKRKTKFALVFGKA